MTMGGFVRGGLPAFVLLIVGLSGCSGGDSGDVTGEDPARPQVADDLGAVQGRVTDDEGLPVAGAVVAIVQLDVQTSSGAGGAFVLNNLEPGRHTLFVNRLGFEAAGKLVDVVPGEVTTVDVVLSAIVVSEPYVENFGPFQGYFECKAGMQAYGAWSGNCGSVCVVVTCVWAQSLGSNDKNVFEFQMSSDDYRSVVGAMQWLPGTSATSGELSMIFSYDGRGGGHWFCSGAGASPVQWRFERPTAEEEAECQGYTRGGDRDPAEPSTEETLMVFASVPFPSFGASNPTGTVANVAFQQHYEMYVSVFYGDPAPAEFSALPDV